MNYYANEAKNVVRQARKAYEQAAKAYLASVAATSEEIDRAWNIINDDQLDHAIEILPQDALGYEENLANTVLELREKESESN
jgi:hypothetical protein